MSNTASTLAKPVGLTLARSGSPGTGSKFHLPQLTCGEFHLPQLTCGELRIGG